MIRGILCQYAPANCRGFEAAHGMAVAVGTSDKAQTNPCRGRSGSNRILIGYSAPMGPGLGMAPPVAAEQRYLEPCINERVDQRKPISVATPNEEHIAWRASGCIVLPGPMNFGVESEWQIMDRAHSGATEIAQICPTRCKHFSISGEGRN